MNTKAIISSTLLTALFTALVAGQTAIAGQATDQGVFATDTVITESVTTDKVNYDAPVLDNAETVLSGRK